MKILVTGSEGTLGQPLVRQLRANGHTVWGCDLKHSNQPNYIRADIGSYRQLERVLKEVRPDLVYHLAAEFGRINGEEYYEQVWQTNVIGTKHLLTLQNLVGHFKVIFASSSEIYGEYADNPGLDEDIVERIPNRPGNDYAISKWVNELQIRNHVATGQKIMTMRFFNAYGPGEYYHPYRSVVCLFIYSALMEIPFTVFRGYHRVFMYIDDFIPTLARAADRFETGAVINIGGEEYRSVEELATVVLQETGAPASLVSYLDQDQHNVVNKRPDVSLAREKLGHDPKILLEEGVAKTVAWMRDVYDHLLP